MLTGTITRITQDKGFGFIRAGGAVDYFFHRGSVDGSFDDLQQGQLVRFEEEHSAKGPRAKSVRLASLDTV
jgi:cold shock CspA family protein